MAGIVRGIVNRIKARRLNLKKELKSNHFRIAIFGSARIEPGDKIYEQVYDLAERIGSRGYDVVTGGGPGLMEAANSGHMVGDKKNRANSIGLVIHLPFENKDNRHLEIRSRFMHFSKRLDTFLSLSHVMVVTTGGIGSLLELYYMWQHLQVHHVSYKPIILIGKMWRDLIDWMKKDVLPGNLVSPQDFDYIYIARDNEQAMAMIDTFHRLFRQEGHLRQIACYKAVCAIPGKNDTLVEAMKELKAKVQTTSKKTSVRSKKSSVPAKGKNARRSAGKR